MKQGSETETEQYKFLNLFKALTMIEVLQSWERARDFK